MFKKNEDKISQKALHLGHFWHIFAYFLNRKRYPHEFGQHIEHIVIHITVKNKSYQNC